MTAKKAQPKPHAYSYLRFSTPEQAQGDSHRRQTGMAQGYALRHGLELDEKLTFNDLGVSAFRGKNAEVGALRAFLNAVENEDVASGSYLLVESLDRISRQSARKASRILEEIVEAGVTLVTLTDEKEWTPEALDTFDWIMANVLLFRGNEESVIKSKRLKSAWRGKRERAREEPITGRVPAWLKLSDGTLGIDRDRARIVKRIFKDAARGDGPALIAKRLNEEGVPVFGTGKQKGTQWHRSYVVKILNNESVIGTFTPHLLEYVDGRRIRTPLEPLQEYYPRVITPELFKAVRDLRSARTGASRPSSTSVHNIFGGGLLRCGRCGGTATHVNKGQGRGQGRYLVCRAAKTGAGCKYEAIRYDIAEQMFLYHASDLIRNAPAGLDLDADIEQARYNVWGLDEAIDDTVEELRRKHTTAVEGRLRRKLDNLGASLERAEADLRALLDRAEAAQGKLVRKRLTELQAALARGPLDRTRVNALLRQAVERIDVDYDASELVLHWRHGGESRCAYSTAAYGFDVAS